MPTWDWDTVTWEWDTIPWVWDEPVEGLSARPLSTHLTIHPPVLEAVVGVVGLTVVQQGSDVQLDWEAVPDVVHYVIHSRTPATGFPFTPDDESTILAVVDTNEFLHSLAPIGTRDYQVFGVLTS